VAWRQRDAKSVARGCASRMGGGVVVGPVGEGGKSVREVSSSRIQCTVFFCGSRGRLSRYFFCSFFSVSSVSHSFSSCTSRPPSIL